MDRLPTMYEQFKTIAGIDISIERMEVVGGFAILFGILTRIAAGLFIIEMIGSTLKVKLLKGFIGGSELDLLIMAICISLPQCLSA